MKKMVLLILSLSLPMLLPAQENVLRLEDLLKKALERNPKIKAAGLEAEASSF